MNRVILSLLSLIGLFVPSSIAAPGDLDATYNATGTLTTAFGTGDDVGLGATLQNDGKLLIAGYSYNGASYDFALARYTIVGALDTSFNGDGKVITTVGTGAQGRNVVVQSDGKIVVAGAAIAGGGSAFGVARYNTNGSVDTTFNGTGQVTTGFNGSSGAYCLAVQNDGKIVVAGRYQNAGKYDVALVRYNADGSLDTSFNDSGKVTTVIGAGNANAASMGIQSDGKIVVAGYYFESTASSSILHVVLVRYNINGSLDTSFNGTGKVICFSSGPYVVENAQAVALQGDGKIILSGYFYDGNSGSVRKLCRYNANGTLDTTFNGTGQVVAADTLGFSVAIQPDGRILAGGFGGSGTSHFKLARYNPNGTIDTTFNATGTVNNAIGSRSYVRSVHIQSDGKIVAAGFCTNGGNYDFAAARYFSGVEGTLATVSNVRAAQVAGTKVVDIFYDLATPSSGAVSVSVDISNDGGTTWTVPAHSLTGPGHGSMVTSGTSKWIRWNSGVDWNNQNSNKVQFRVVAGGTVSPPSPNVRVDTTDWLETISVSMHRVNANVLRNASSGAGIDEPLEVTATNRGLLASQPALQGNNGLFVTGGLVADGVTPLLFRIVTNAPTPGGTTYEVRLKPPFFGGSYSGSLGSLLLVENGNSFVHGSTVTLSTAKPDAYVVVRPISPQELTPDLAGRVELTLEVRNSSSALFPVRRAYSFALRRPPVALVHGYNVEDPAWGASFTGELDDREGFVFAVGYGIENDQNTNASLKALAGVLDGELRTQVEDAPSLSNWAFTRYDTIGHSQGGVLLRMLCSQSTLAGGGNISSYGFEAFRNGENHYRGRFRRVVTLGSPHAGSPLAEMGYQLRKVQGVPYGHFVADFFAEKKIDRLIQTKFRIGDDSDLGIINNTIQCDPMARIHVIRTTIDDGEAPGAQGQNSNSIFYDALYLNRPEPLIPPDFVRPGLVVVPNGSDAVVDVDNQEAGANGALKSTITSEDIVHANLPVLPNPSWQTNSSTVGARVKTLLNGSSSSFGPITMMQLQNLGNLMETRRPRIANLALAIKSGQSSTNTANFGRVALAAAPAPMGGDGHVERLADAEETLQFALQPPTGESPNGTVEWLLKVFGPPGADALPTMVASGAFGQQLALTIPGTLVGQVVLSVRFPSTTGKLIVGAPQMVFERAPGALTTVAVNPATIEAQIGTEVAIAVLGIYDGSIVSPLFTSSDNILFESSNPLVAAVDMEGRVALNAVGTATITATYNGTLIAVCPVAVRDVVPVVTSSASVVGTTGLPFSHQITASQNVQSFVGEPLPAGLMLNTQTGLISGTPTVQGATAFMISVSNANGTGTRQIDFFISGSPGAPTDVGIDTIGVREEKPVGTLVGRLVTTDPNPLDTFSYQLVYGTGSTDNESFSITGDRLFTAALLSRATQSTVSLRVRTTDSSSTAFEKVIVLAVVTPPAITRQPDPQYIFTGDTALFAVEASGLEPLNYQWKKNGMDVPGANSRIFEITGTVLAHAGNYQVTVTNADGTATSTPVSLTVEPVSYSKWLSLVPNATGAPVYEPLGDYNGDGVVNFLEFAMGVPAGAATGRGKLPFVSAGTTGRVFNYSVANGTGPLTFRIMKSTNLTVWQEHFPLPADVTSTDRGGFTEIQLRLPAAPSTQFLKLEVQSL